MGAEEGRSHHQIPDYDKACILDADVKRFNDSLMLRTDRVLSSLVSGVDERGLSFKSLKDVTANFLDVDQDVVHIILEYKHDVWGSTALFELVKDYFDHSLATLDFCTELDKCIKRARQDEMILQVAINKVSGSDQETLSQEQCEQVLLELNNFVDAGNPFSQDIVNRFQEVYDRQVELQHKLHSKKKQLDKKLKFVKAWTKVSSIILAATCATLLICAVVAAAMGVPGVLELLSLATALPLDSMARWFNSLWNKYLLQLSNRSKVVGEADRKIFVLIRELDTIRSLVDSLSIEIDSIIHCIQFGKDRGDPFTVLLAVERLRTNQGAFIRDLDELEEHVDRCGKTIRAARTIVLRRIIRKRSISF